MSLLTLRTGLLTAAVAAMLTLGSEAHAQCATCAQPTVAYSPVVSAPQRYVAYSPVAAQPVAQPVVVQQTTVGWYPGKWIGSLFRPRPTTTVVAAPGAQPMAAPSPTYVTAAYRPTYPPSYTTYSAAYTVARPVALSSCSTCVSNPCACASYRPVTLTASPCCPTCPTGCPTGGCGSSGVATVGYDAPASTGCASCASGGASSFAAPSAGLGEPTLAPNEAVPETRVNKLPAEADPSHDSAAGDETSYWDAPQLFDGRDRSAQRPSTQRPTAHVWNAVYHQPAKAQPSQFERTAYRPAPAPRHKQVGASGWRSAD